LSTCSIPFLVPLPLDKCIRICNLNTYTLPPFFLLCPPPSIPLPSNYNSLSDLWLLYTTLTFYSLSLYHLIPLPRLLIPPPTVYNSPPSFLIFHTSYIQQNITRPPKPLNPLFSFSCESQTCCTQPTLLRSSPSYFFSVTTKRPPIGSFKTAGLYCKQFCWCKRGKLEATLKKEKN